MVDLLALPFDLYQRYTVVTQTADLIRDGLGRSQLNLLDVGGFYRTRWGEDILPLAHFLPDDSVVAADMVSGTLPGYVMSSGEFLPFADESFDMVASCDTLEHVPAEKRWAFVDELLRVARYCAVIVAPFASAPTIQAERILGEYLTSQNLSHEQLEEHTKRGLPDGDKLRSRLAERNLSFVDFADGYLHHWLTMMLVKHTPGFTLDLHLDLDRYYNKHFSADDRREPGYRHVFVVAKPGLGDLLSDNADHFATRSGPPAVPGFGFVGDLLRFLRQAQPNAPVETLDGVRDQLAAVQSRMATLEAENKSLRQIIAGYEQGRFIRLMRWLHLQRKRLRRTFSPH
jgi:SAM-dependent methyltransferase